MSSGDTGRAIDKIRYSHDAMVDLIISSPMISQAELAAHFGYTQGWVSQVMSSDVFKARLAVRKQELVDPVIAATIEERFEAIARESARVVMEKLQLNPTGDFALKALAESAKALGLGQQKGPAVVGNQTNYIVMTPRKAESAEEWMAQHAPALPDPRAVGERVVGPERADLPAVIEGSASRAD